VWLWQAVRALGYRISANLGRLFKYFNVSIPWWPSTEGSGFVTAVVRVQSLAWELLHASGAAKKKKKKTQYYNVPDSLMHQLNSLDCT